MIIGKIPGYNDNIQNNSSSIVYTNRLLSNLTIASFTPVGYSINLDTKDLTNSIYKIGSTIKPIAKDLISTYNALTQWKLMQLNALCEEIVDEFKIVCTNESTITETISNSYHNNMLDDLGNKLGESTYGQLAASAKKLTTSLDTSTAISILDQMRSETTGGAAGSLLLGKMIGIQSAMPKIWTSSSYNNTASFTIKLISPSGHPDDVDQFIIKPLRTLILAASPVTFDGVTYGYPPLWKVESKGLATTKLAAITTISIARGGQDTVFNRYNQPTNIDVRLVVEPIIEGFATPLNDLLTETPDSNGNVSMIVQSPRSIINPMLNESIQDSAIQLKPLILS